LTTSYEIRSIDLSDQGIADASQLLNSVFPWAKWLTPGYLHWEYNLNPLGPEVGFNAYLDGELAGHYVVQPIEANLFGTITKGLLSMNTATHPNHQRKNLFTTLAQKTYDTAREKEYEFVIGVANANSTPGFVGRLGFQLVRPLDAKIGIGPVIRQSHHEDLEFQRTWSDEVLQWRIANPAQQYRVRRNRYSFVIEGPTGKLGIRAILGEFPIDMDHQFQNVAGPRRYNPLTLWIGIDDSIKWSRSMYFDIPRRLRPSPLNLIFKDLTGNNRELAADKVKFQLIDFDVY
jgi:GNAT superfamily N-acetyltransferase